MSNRSRTLPGLAEKAKVGLGLAGFVAFIAVVAGMAINSVAVMPDNALVYADVLDERYHSPPCALRRDFPHFAGSTRLPEGEGFMVVPAAVAKDMMGFRPDEECRDHDGFVHSRPLIVSWLTDLGIFGRSRWNADGSWNW